MNISTWNKDSHGLYDYESGPDNYKNEVCKIENTTIIYRDSVGNHCLIQRHELSCFLKPKTGKFATASPPLLRSCSKKNKANLLPSSASNPSLEPALTSPTTTQLEHSTKLFGKKTLKTQKARGLHSVNYFLFRAWPYCKDGKSLVHGHRNEEYSRDLDDSRH